MLKCDFYVFVSMLVRVCRYVCVLLCGVCVGVCRILCDVCVWWNSWWCVRECGVVC